MVPGKFAAGIACAVLMTMMPGLSLAEEPQDAPTRRENASSRYPDCVQPKDSEGHLPMLAEVLTCQREARRAFIADYERRYGRLPSNLRLDALDEHQRREAREHALRHPELATMTSETEVVVPGFLDRLKGVYQAAKSRLKGLLHKDEKPGVPSDAATLFSGGADGLKTVLDKSKWDGKRPMDVSQEIKNYNREVDENLDPAMKQYFKKKGETPR